MENPGSEFAHRGIERLSLGHQSDLRLRCWLCGVGTKILAMPLSLGVKLAG